MFRPDRRSALLLAAAALAAPVPARAAGSLIVQGGSAVPSIIYLPMYVADQAGFFKREGVAVDLRYSSGGSLATQLVANGNADLAHIVWQPAIQAAARGAKGKFFYQTFTRSSFFVAAPAGGPIKALSDLAGKNIGVVNVASPGIFTTKSSARAAGIDPKTLQFLPVGVGAQALAALSSGRVDALCLWDAEYANYEAIGQKLTYLPHPKLGQVGNGGFYASDKALADKAESIQAFARAVAEGTAYLLANPEDALEMYWKAVPAARPQGSDAQATAQGLVALKFVAHTFDVEHRPDKLFGAINPRNVQAFIDALHEEGEIPQAIPAAEIIDTRFVEAANRFDRAAATRKRS
jgi:NitT/TauT family transport system substrate-binding protein